MANERVPMQAPQAPQPSTQTNIFRGPTSQPYRGPRRVRRTDGRAEVWVEGSGYLPEDSLERLTVQERQEVMDARDRARGQQDALPMLRRFEELNRTEATGSIGQIVGQTFNIPQIAGRPDEIEMDSIRDRLTPRQRQGMPGAASDRDVAMFRGSLPGMHRVGPANSAIIRNLEREAADSQAFAEFLDWYWPQRGTTAGATEAWGRYRSQGGERPWREFFAAPQQGGGEASRMSDEELERIAGGGR